MKEELRLIVDALDGKLQFQLQSGEERGRGSDHVIDGEDVDFSDLDPGQPRRFFLTSTLVAYTIFGSFSPVRVRGDRSKIKHA
jgi:hypothetical protein